MSAAPPLPDGLVVFVKRECPTCELVVPVLEALREGGGVHVIVQDDPGFPEGLAPRHDADLALSWHHDIEAVPTLLRVVDGREKE
ncbi:MAG: thioredoxin, partial [Myxococcota bacterium]